MIILAAAIIAMAWGLWRVLNSKTSSPTQQGMGLAAILIGMAVAVTANLTDSDSGIMTAVSMLAAAGMLVLAIFGVRALKRPEGGATQMDVIITVAVTALFLIGSIFHA